MIWGLIASIGISIISSIFIRRQQKRAAERAAARAREAAGDAAAIEARVEAAGQAVPLHYGYSGTAGIVAFAEALDEQPAGLHGTAEKDPAAFPGGKRTAGQLQGKAGARLAGDKRQYLFMQLLLGIGRHATFAIAAPAGGTSASGVSGAIVSGPGDAHLAIGEVWIDGFTDRAPSRFDDQWQITTPAFGTARTAVSAAFPPPMVDGVTPSGGALADLANQLAGTINQGRWRTAESRFRGFTRAEVEAWFDRDDPVFGRLPNPYMAILGRVLPDVGPSGELASTLTFSTNPVRVLLDYMLGGVASDEFFGPRIPPNEIDLLSFRFAIQLVDASSPNGLVPLPLPPDMAEFLGQEYATWGEYFGAGLTPEGGEGRAGALVLAGMQRAYRGAFTVGRYHYDGQIGTEIDYREATRRILDAIPGAYLFRTLAGQWKVVVPDPDLDTSAVPSITDDILVGLPVRQWPDAKDRLNGAKARFVNANAGFARDVVVFPSTEAARVALLEEDGGQPLRETIDVPGASNPIHAYARLASHVLMSRRVSYEWETTLAGLPYEPGDVVNLDPGLWKALVRISGVEITETDTIRMQGLEYVPLDYRFHLWPVPEAEVRLPADPLELPELVIGARLKGGGVPVVPPKRDLFDLDREKLHSSGSIAIGLLSQIDPPVEMVGQGYGRLRQVQLLPAAGRINVRRNLLESKFTWNHSEDWPEPQGFFLVEDKIPSPPVTDAIIIRGGGVTRGDAIELDDLRFAAMYPPGWRFDSDPVHSGSTADLLGSFFSIAESGGPGTGFQISGFEWLPAPAVFSGFSRNRAIHVARTPMAGAVWWQSSATTTWNRNPVNPAFGVDSFTWEASERVFVIRVSWAEAIPAPPLNGQFVIAPGDTSLWIV